MAAFRRFPQGWSLVNQMRRNGSSINSARYLGLGPGRLGEGLDNMDDLPDLK